jgi:hypothetical protein
MPRYRVVLEVGSWIGRGDRQGALLGRFLRAVVTVQFNDIASQ